MDTVELKKFAQAARRQLIEQVSVQLERVLNTDSGELREKAKSISELKTQIETTSRQAVVERVAYTWFNRFCALRFMDVNGYTKVRVVSPSEGFTLPEILTEAKLGHIDDSIKVRINDKKVADLLTGRVSSRDAQSEVYRILLVGACNYYHSVMPFLFEKIDDYTELLMPEDLLSDSSVLAATREALTTDACKDVEVIGWLYQFYISERKDEVMARKSAVPTEDIPAVTQLFTPHWIVSYLVENSLGRLWLLNRPNSRLREHMPYYIEGEPETDFLKISKPEEIRLCDPACGSGHMLTYAFDLLTLIYEEEGYASTEIPALILRHNLYGLEICPRAAQLAQLALVFKAREKSRRFFEPEHMVRPNIIELCDVRFAECEIKDYVKELDLGELFDQPVINLLHQFKDAKNFGSLIQPCLDEKAIAEVRCAIEAKDIGGQLFLHDTHLRVLRVLAQAVALTQRYHVVVANPPYMGWKTMNSLLKSFAKEKFADAREDIFSMFIDRCYTLPMASGYISMMTPFTWMFLGSYEKLRKLMLQRSSLTSLIRPEYHAFFESAFVPICAFSITCKCSMGRKGTFIDLSEFYGADQQEVKALEAIRNPNCGWSYRAAASDFQRIPGSPIAYVLSEPLLQLFFDHKTLGENFTARQGLATTENARFVRLWYEVAVSHIGFNFTSQKETIDSFESWFPYNKGGEFKKWWGNQRYVVNWANDGAAIKAAIVSKYPYLNGNPNFVAKNQDFYFRGSVSFSKIGSGFPSFKLFPNGFIFDVAGSSIFAANESDQIQVLAFCNTNIARTILAALAPTLNIEIQQIQSLPLSLKVSWPELRVVVDEMVSIARADWDNFETSWDFRDQPLLRSGLKGVTLEASWRNWEAQSIDAIRRMQELETENNRLFIAAYSLEGELQPEVPEDQITLARAEVKKDMAAFLSYAVGCMMGRYSLDKPGLILANQGETLEDYLKIIPKPTFTPDKDNVIPIVDGDWFTDDIVAGFKEFLKVTFGDEHFQENLDFIETAIGKDLRSYFLKDFYKDHIKTYKKRPIYWLFSSPNGSFNALIYMHRYRPDTISVVLNDYLRDFKAKLTAYKTGQEQVSNSTASSATEKTRAIKEIEKLRKVFQELDIYEREVLYPLATQQIAIDLDDGVKVNYAKFGKALKKIPGLEADEE